MMDVTRRPISVPTRTPRQRKSCVQCARAKRRCDKTIPSCLRCVDKGIRCSFPSRNNSIAHFGDFERVGPTQLRGDDDEVAITVPMTPRPHPATPGTLSALGSAPANTDAKDDYRWFLCPKSWTHHHGSRPQDEVTEQSLPNFIDTLKRWAAAWIRDGHSPLMHGQLYRDGMPECIQEAYSTQAAYNAASQQGKQTALRLVESRVNKLLGQAQEDLAIEGMSPVCLLDTPTQLARTQALFVYQMIRLFDGDIRSRAQAEGHIETLYTWCRQMLESAQLDCSTAELLAASAERNIDAATAASLAGTDNPMLSTQTSLQPSQTLGPSFSHNNPIPTNTNLAINSPLPNLNLLTTTNTFSLPRPTTTTTTSTPTPNPHSTFSTDPNPFQTWRAFLLSESIRRIYLASTFMNAVYNTLKQGWSECPGGLAFTACRGAWDARSAWGWMAAVRKNNTNVSDVKGDGGRDSEGGGNGEVSGAMSPWVMVKSLDSWVILEGARPEEVDEFAVAVLEITYGVESVEKWRFERGGG